MRYLMSALVLVTGLAAFAFIYSQQGPASPASTPGNPEGISIRLIATGFLKGRLRPIAKSYSHDRIIVTGGLPYLASEIHKLLDSGPGHDRSLVVDLGGHLSGSVITERTRGAAMVDLLNLLPLEASLISNLEFSFGQEDLAKRIEQAKYRYISSNLKFEDTNLTKRVSKDIIVDKGGIKIGILGLTPLRLKQISQRKLVEGVDVDPDYDQVISLAQKLKADGMADLVIVLSKIPVDHPSPEAVKAFTNSAVDVVLGIDYKRGGTDMLEWGTTLATGLPGGNRGSRVKIVDLMIHRSTKKILEHQARVENVTVSGTGLDAGQLNTPAPDVEQLLTKILGGYPELNERVGEVGNSLPHRWRGESLMANLVTDAIRSETGSDLAFMNSGAVQEGLEPGPLLMADLFEALPWPNEIVKFSATGQQIYDLVADGIPREYIYHPSGFTYTCEQRPDRSVKSLALKIGNEDIDLEARYTVATSDFAFKRIEGLANEKADSKGMLRDMVETYIRKNSPVKRSIEGRDVFIRVEPEQSGLSNSLRESL